MKRDFSIISWNVNGIRAVLRKGFFVPFVEKYQPDILCLQETKANREDVLIDLPDYKEYFNSAQKKGYSGTAILSKEPPISIQNDFPNSIIKKFNLLDNVGRDSSTEGRVITAEYEKFFVVTVYTPNSKEDLSRLPLRELGWDPAFLCYVKMLERKKPVIFCGDLNVAHAPIDLSNPKANEGKHGYTLEERAGINQITDANFVDTFRHFHSEGEQYTWWSHWANARARNIGWRIDYIFASKALVSSIQEAFILSDVMGSDHCPVGIRLQDKS